jgi:hypothetical protein
MFAVRKLRTSAANLELATVNRKKWPKIKNHHALKKPHYQADKSIQFDQLNDCFV